MYVLYVCHVNSSTSDAVCLSTIRSNNCVPAGPAAASTATAQSLSDISEYLKDIPLDWLSDAANLLNHTLQFNCLTPNLSSSNGSSAGVDDGEVSAIVRGAKHVRVPPGECCMYYLLSLLVRDCNVSKQCMFDSLKQ